MPRMLLAGLASVAIAAIAIGAASASNRAAPSDGTVSGSNRSAPSSPAASASSGAAPASGSALAFDPGDFVPGAPIDNPFFPLPVGRTLVYRGTKEGLTQRDVVRVTTRTRTIDGVLTVAVRDVAKHHHSVLERTTDFYAQDKLGNVWYLGESTVSFGPRGKRDSSGSWMGGVNGAIPGLIMEADPRIPDAYRQEFLAGEAEDAAWVVRRGGAVTVPFGKIRHKLSTLEATRIEPGAYDLKVYGRGLGIVLERALSGPPEVAKLVRVIEP